MPAEVKPKVDLMMDSGAYSAWRQNKVIDLERYCDFLLENQDWITSYINLDVINPKDPEAAAAASFKNLQYMRSRGLDPMAVYHIGENIDWLNRVLDLGCDFIGIAALSMRAGDRMDDFYSFAWSHLVDANGLPVVRVHGLGETRRRQLMKFPWTSADSLSWLSGALVSGTVKLPGGGFLSMRNDHKSSKSAPSIADLSGENMDQFFAVMEAGGIQAENIPLDVVGSRLFKMYLAARFYQELEAEIQQQRKTIRHFTARPTGFFDLTSSAAKRTKTLAEGFSLYLCAGTNDLPYPVLAVADHPRILMSYHPLQKDQDHTETRTGLSKLRAYVSDPAHAMETVEKWRVATATLREFIREK